LSLFVCGWKITLLHLHGIRIFASYHSLFGVLQSGIR